MHPYCSAYVDSAFHLLRDGKMITGECQGKVGRITSAGWQVTLCASHMTSDLSSAYLRFVLTTMRYTDRRILYFYLLQ